MEVLAIFVVVGMVQCLLLSSVGHASIKLLRAESQKCMHEVQFVAYDIGWNVQVADVNRSDEVLVTKATQSTSTINLHTFEEGSLVVYVLYRPFKVILCPEDYVPNLYGQRYPVKVCVRLTSAVGGLRSPPRLFFI